jgi:serine/threonine protein kinase
MIGKSIGRYRIDEQLGEGGMAVVYKAFDSHLDTFVALKVIRGDWLLSEGRENLLVRFESEAKRVARLSHPNIISILDYGQFEDAPYLVMKFIPGGTLKDRLGRPMHWRDAARILIPVTRALGYAHQQGLIHRDVKPGNILLNETGEPLLSDFGLAKILYSEGTRADLTSSSMVLGTPDYMAPEQALGNSIDHRVDIYALGLVFYEMITGRKPFTADTPMGVVMKQITEQPPPPRQFVPDLPLDVEQVLKKALAKDPGDRYPNAAAFCYALELIVGSQEMPKAQTLKQEQTLEILPTRTPPPPSHPPQIPENRRIQGVKPPTHESQPVPAKKSAGLAWLGGAGILILGLLCLAAAGSYFVFAWLPSQQKTPTALALIPSPSSTVKVTSTPLPIRNTATLPEVSPTSPRTGSLTETPSPNQQSTERARNRIARTETAEARVNAESGRIMPTLQYLQDQGVITNTSGTYHPLDDFNESWAQIGWYQYWDTGYGPENFVITAHTEWESASRIADWYASGCGFVFHETDVKNHYLIYLALDGNIYFKAYIAGEFRELGKAYAGKVEPVQGQADVMLAVEGSKITYFVNGKQVFQIENNELSSGSLEYTLVSGTNKDFGTRCKISNAELWVLDR